MAVRNQPNIVVIGGGTGSFTLLSGLKRYTSNLTALVNMADDGGSTGQLRDELGVLPPGDVRQCLVALSDTPEIRDLFTYRFDEGSLEGHSFGNLFISALEKMNESFEEAVSVAGEVLRINGEVIPLTLDQASLIARTKSGLEIHGEHKIGSVRLDRQKPELRFAEKVVINPRAKEAIMESDLVVIAPGNLYGSIGPSLIIEGVGSSLRDSAARKVCVANLVTKPGQTDNFTVDMYASEIERLSGGKVLEYVVFNTDEPTKRMRDVYVRDGEYMLEFDLDVLDAKHYTAIGLPLIDKTPVKHDKSDKIANVRSLIRHNSDAIAREIMKIYFS